MPKKRTEYKKEVVVESIPQTSMVRLKFKGGGELPNFLKGSYLSKTQAMNRFEIYKRNKGIK